MEFNSSHGHRTSTSSTATRGVRNCTSGLYNYTTVQADCTPCGGPPQSGGQKQASIIGHLNNFTPWNSCNNGLVALFRVCFCWCSTIIVLQRGVLWEFFKLQFLGVAKRVVFQFWRMFPGTKTGTRVHSDVLPERKPERGYVRMFPRNENRNKGTFAKTTLLRNHPFVSWWNSNSKQFKSEHVRN